MQFVQAFNSNVEEMFDYGQHMLHKRRADPKPDLMSAIARATSTASCCATNISTARGC